MVLVDHRGDPAHVEQMRRFWRERGIDRVMTFHVMNRGGSLFVDHMQYELYPERRRRCWRVPWKRRCVWRHLGASSTGRSSTSSTGSWPLSCRANLSAETCNLDPINRLTERAAW